MKAILTTALSLFIPLLMAQTAFRMEAIQYLKQGEVQLKQGNWDGALQLYTMAVETDVSFAEAYFKRAQLFERTTHFTEANRDYHMARQLNPYIHYFHDFSMRVHLIKLRYSGSTDPNSDIGAFSDPEEFVQLFVNYTMYDEIFSMDSSRNETKSSIQFLHQQAVKLLRQNDLMGAQKIVNVGLLNETESERFLDIQGLIFLLQTELETAKEYFDKAIKKNPNYMPSYYNRSIVLRYYHKPEVAKKDLNQVVDHLQSEKVYFNRALTYKETGDYSNALDDYNTAISMNDNFDSARFNRMYVNKKLGNYFDAMEDAEFLIEKSPENSELWDAKGIAQLLIGDYHEALDSFDEAISLNPDCAECYYHRGLTSILLQSPLDACPDIERSIELNLEDQKEIMDCYCGF